MLRREELLRCGKGALSRRRRRSSSRSSSRSRDWGLPGAGRDGEVPEGACRRAPLLKASQPRRGGGGGGGGGSCSPGWHHRRRGRHPSFCRTYGRRRHYYHHQQQQQEEEGAAKAWPRSCCCWRRRPARPRVLLSLRPVNMMGKRAPGMRAPRNTNQFLMQEKYQLMHLRSDSVGSTESGGSDCEMDPLDMDSYLGVLENARGALPDCPAAGEDEDDEPLPPPLPRSSPVAELPPSQVSGLRFFGGCLEGGLQEESLQYFPSEDDVIQSELFMERDFQEFCSRIA